MPLAPAPRSLCAACRRSERGFGWFDPTSSRPPRPSVSFCSITCQGWWVRLARRSTAMVDLTEHERAALRAAMRAMAEVMAEIGWTTALNALSEQQVLTLAEVAVGAFQDAMRASASSGTPEVPF
ncbi:hypothetical protein GCM10010964_37200 [Caldovatus sediminis]|uniref:Uncharacterized protein n=2 Tax=Roseomonadaceae TaxID=3385906 RepID=A0A8J2ZE75_9PROT|nr:DUF6511 domain-containing protein [Caldovatus sediminis]GGG46373.1 hypothetical protein GCM10010964_37200 [Caldovatus sediminis]